MTKPTKPVTLHFTSDPSHGWLHVNRDVAKMIMGDDYKRISQCSYQRGATIYLEEDSDAGLFRKACKARGVDLDIKVTYYERTAPICSYATFYP
jgi:hypothetical protein